MVATHKLHNLQFNSHVVDAGDAPDSVSARYWVSPLAEGDPSSFRGNYTPVTKLSADVDDAATEITVDEPNHFKDGLVIDVGSSTGHTVDGDPSGNTVTLTAGVSGAQAAGATVKISTANRLDATFQTACEDAIKKIVEAEYSAVAFS